MIRHQGKNFLYQPFIALIITIGVFGLFFVFSNIGKIYITVLARTSASHLADQTEKGSIGTLSDSLFVLPGFDFWTLQTGIFRNKENAISEQLKLRNLGFNAVIFKNEFWVVGIGYGHKREELNLLQERLKQSGVANMPKQVVVEEQSFKVKENGSEMILNLLESVNNNLGRKLSQDNIKESLEIMNQIVISDTYKDLGGLYNIMLNAQGKDTAIEQNAGLELYSEYQTMVTKLSSERK